MEMVSNMANERERVAGWLADLLIVRFPLAKQGSNDSVYLRGNLIITADPSLKEGVQLLEFINGRIILR